MNPDNADDGLNVRIRPTLRSQELASLSTGLCVLCAFLPDARLVRLAQVPQISLRQPQAFREGSA